MLAGGGMLIWLIGSVRRRRSDVAGRVGHARGTREAGRAQRSLLLAGFHGYSVGLRPARRARVERRPAI